MRFGRMGRPSLLKQCLLTGLLIWAAFKSGPLLVSNELQMLPIAVALFAGIAVLGLIGQLLHAIAEGLDWMDSHTGTQKSGSAQWGKVRALKKELSRIDAAPFWGLSHKDSKKLFIDFSSNAFVVGPSGVGKGHMLVVPMIFLIRHSKIIMDFKPELRCICKKGLEKLGQTVIALDPFGKYSDRIGNTECLNVLDGITDNLYRPGRLRQVLSIGAELSMQLYEDPPSSKGDDQFWRDGTRKLLSFGSISESMLQGRSATLVDVAFLFDDRSRFERRLCTFAGVDLKEKPDPEGPYPFELSDWALKHDDEELNHFLQSMRGKAAGLLHQMHVGEKTFDSFWEGAQQALAPYGFGELSSAMGPTTFDASALKDSDSIVNLFIVGEASRSQATQKYFGIMQWYLQLILKRHTNTHVPVYLINDEINNYSIYGYISLLSWGRGFGIRTLNILQNFSAFEQRYGKQAVEVLNSESEIKLFLPGQRSTSTIKKIVELLGQQSLMVASLSADKDGWGLRENLSESARPLMTEDEVRRSKHGILIVRDHRPLLQKPVSYSAIHPLRDLADVNPHHGKPFRNKVEVKLQLPKPEVSTP